MTNHSAAFFLTFSSSIYFNIRDHVIKLVDRKLKQKKVLVKVFLKYFLQFKKIKKKVKLK